MKYPILLLALLSINTASHSQQMLSQDKALSQLYSSYDAATGTAQWICTEKPSQDDRSKSDVPWPCWKEDAIVAVEPLLMSMVNENGATKIYFVADAKPAKDPNGYECHACSPEIGVAVFVLKDKQWAIESVNAAIGSYGAWGGPYDVALIDTDSAHNQHGILVSGCDEGQGYAECREYLLLPLGKTVKQVWWISDEQDNFGAYDPTDEMGDKIKWRSSASFRFDDTFQNDDQKHYEYSDIEVISQGRDMQEESGHLRLKSENWTDLYRFENGQYKRIRHTDFIEAKKPANPSPKPAAKSK